MNTSNRLVLISVFSFLCGVLYHNILPKDVLHLVFYSLSGLSMILAGLKSA